MVRRVALHRIVVRSAGLDREGAAVWHRVAPVEREVDDHLLDLAGIDHDPQRVC